MKELVSFVTMELEKLADKDKASAMAAYMKTEMPFFGVQAKDRRAIARSAKKAFSITTHKKYLQAIKILWKQAHREQKYIAIDLARAYKSFVTIDSLDLYEKMVREGAWWDFVDDLAHHLVGQVLLDNPEKMYPKMDTWLQDDDFWIRRVALLCQNTFKDKTDEKRLFSYCLSLAPESEFFIRKAIGWALRQYSYTAPKKVKTFLLKNKSKLSGLSFREGAKGLKRMGLM